MDTLSRQLSQDEIKDGEVSILRAFHEFCENNHLVYSLAYGTLIGAVRHKGFIPWDDDIDVVMPRPDYDRFIQLAVSDVFPKGCRVQATEVDGFIQSFAKVIDPTISVKSGRNRSETEEWLWIDVFPVDGLPEQKKERSSLFFKAKVYGALSVADQLDPSYKSTFAMQLVASVFGPIARHSSLGSWAATKLKKLSISYPFGMTEKAGVIGWGFGQSEVFPTSWFTDRILLPFEGHRFYCPRHYDAMLSSQYGDYMTLPPEDKRVTHVLTAFTE